MRFWRLPEEIIKENEIQEKWKIAKNREEKKAEEEQEEEEKKKECRDGRTAFITQENWQFINLI
jgi:hypothetical protein